MRHALLTALALAVATAAPAQETDPSALTVSVAPVNLDSEDPARREYGWLSFVGGAQLISEDSRFGGFSGLELDRVNDNTLSGGVIGDAGFAGQIVIGLNPRGGPQSVELRGEPFRGPDGEPLGKREADAEGLAAHGTLIAVSFERDHRIVYFHPGSGAEIEGPRPEGLDPRDDNRGLEALAFLPGGVMLAGQESVSALGGGHPVWRFADPRDRSEAAFTLASTGPGFGLVGFDATPRGNLVILERFYAPGVGNRIAVGWLDGETARAASGAVTPRRLALLEPPLTLDNFEGVAAVENPDGTTGLWMISDDNFSRRQRTLLMAFAFDEAALEAGGLEPAAAAD